MCYLCKMKTAEEILKDKLVNYIIQRKTSSQDRADVVLEAMEEYGDQFKPKWISVNERLPDVGEKVLIIIDVRKWDPARV